MHVDCHCTIQAALLQPVCPYLFYKSSVYQNFSTVCVISDSLRRRQTDASKMCQTRRHLLPDVYVIKPNKSSAFPGSADSLRCDFSYIRSFETLLCSSQHFRTFCRHHAGRSHHLADKVSSSHARKKSTGWACHRLYFVIMRFTASVSFVSTT